MSGHNLVIRFYGRLCPYCRPHVQDCAGHAMLNGPQGKKIDAERLARAREKELENCESHS